MRAHTETDTPARMRAQTPWARTRAHTRAHSWLQPLPPVLRSCLRRHICAAATRPPPSHAPSRRAPRAVSRAGREHGSARSQRVGRRWREDETPSAGGNSPPKAPGSRAGQVAQAGPAQGVSRGFSPGGPAAKRRFREDPRPPRRTCDLRGRNLFPGKAQSPDAGRMGQPRGRPPRSAPKPGFVLGWLRVEVPGPPLVTSERNRLPVHSGRHSGGSLPLSAAPDSSAQRARGV